MAKLKNLLKQLENINEKRKTKINIVVFPEYCIPLEIEKSIRDFVNSTKIIVIGNYYNVNERSSTSYIYLPKGWCKQELYECKKITISDYDKEVLSKVNQKKVLKFWWKPENKEKHAYFQILTCKDYLYFTSIEGIKKYPNCIDMNNAGIIFVPMSTPEIMPFEQKASSILREVNIEFGAKSVVSVLCNATDLVNHHKGEGICGQTQFVSPIDLNRYEKIVLARGFEGCLLAEINPFKTIIKPTPTNESPNSVVYSIVKYRLDKNYFLIPEDVQKIMHSGVIINPYIFEYFGLKKIYALMVINDYKKLKDNLKDLPAKYYDMSVGVHGIYGYHDILIQSYEQISDKHAKKVIELRLWPLIKNEKSFDRNFFGYSIVQKPIKIQGIRLDKIESIENEYCPYIYNIRDNFRKIISGKEVNLDEIDDLVEKSICLRTPYDLSDISENEINQNKLEFLILIEVKSTDEHSSTEDIKQIFVNELLENVLDDERVRTVEQIQSSGEAFVRANFILHIVGKLKDLNEILIGKIYGHCNEQFVCKTQVILPAEKILTNKYPVFLEESVDSFTEKQAIEIMFNCKNYLTPNEFINPFSINMIGSDNRERIIQITRLFDELNSKYYKNDKNFNKKDMFKFIYRLSNILSECINNPSFKDNEMKIFIESSTQFIVIVAKKIEETLKKMIEEIIEENNISNEEFNEIIKLASLSNTGNEGHFNCLSIQIGTTQFAFSMIHRIFQDEKSIEKFRKILRSKFSEESNADETIRRKENLAKKINDDLLIYLGQMIDDKSMKITLMNLEGFSKVRNIFTHDKPIKKNELSMIPTYVFGGLKYLLFINKKMAVQINSDLFKL